MKVRAATISVLLLALVCLVCWTRRPSDRVTIKCRQAPLEQVLRSLSRQTGEKIFAQPGATNLITLNVKRVPLDEALAIVSGQANCRCTAIYGLHSSSESRLKLEAILHSGTAHPAAWTNLNFQPAPGAGLAFARNLEALGQPVNLRLENKSVLQAAMAVSRFGDIKVVPEDGTTGTINLDLAQVPVQAAVAELARQAQKKVARYYVLEPFFRPQAPDLAQDSFVPFDPGSSPPELNGATPVMIPFGNGPPGLDPLPPPIQNGEAPSPEALNEAMRSKIRKDLRTTTPEQRADRWRQAQRMPPAPPPGQTPPEAR